MRKTMAVLSVFLLLFAGALAEESVSLPGSLQKLQKGTFSGAEGLRKVVLPSGMTGIEEGAFSGSALQEINFPESLETVPAGAFEGCGHIEAHPEGENSAALIGELAAEGVDIACSGEVLEEGTYSLSAAAGQVLLRSFTADRACACTLSSEGAQGAVCILYDADGKELKRDGGAYAAYSLTRNLEEGETLNFGLMLADETQAGAVPLAISAEDLPQAVELGRTILEITDYEELTVRFTAKTAGRYVFQTTGDADTVGTLVDPESGEILARGDDVGNNDNFAIYHTLKAGETVYLRIELYEEASASFPLVIAKTKEPKLSYSFKLRKYSYYGTDRDLSGTSASVSGLEDSMYISPIMVGTNDTSSDIPVTVSAKYDGEWIYWYTDIVEAHSSYDFYVERPDAIGREGRGKHTIEYYVNGTKVKTYTYKTTGKREEPMSTSILYANTEKSLGVYGISGKWLMFTAPQAGTYHFYTDRSGDTAGFLFSEDMTELCWNDDASEDDGNFSFYRSLAANETVFLWVMPYDDMEGGMYYIHADLAD